MTRFLKYIIILSLSILNYCCGIYGFVISSLPKEVKTYSIKEFISKNSKNEAFVIISSIERKLKNKLRAIKLKEVFEKGNIRFQGELLDYKLNRMGEIFELSVKMEFIYKDYKGKENKIPITKNKKLPDGQSIVTRNILNEIISESTSDILNSTISKW